MLVLLSVALIGGAIHYPIYRLIGFIANRFARGEEEVVATIKVVGGMVLYPLMWIALGVWAGVRWGARYGFVVAIGLPFLAYFALCVFEALDVVIGRVRATMRRNAELRCQALRREFIEIAEEIGKTSS